jgi:hypothetical protein
MSNTLPSAERPRPEFQSPDAYLAWLEAFSRQRAARIDALDAAVSSGDQNAIREWLLRSKTGSKSKEARPWTGPSPVRVQELKVHFGRCDQLTRNEVVSLANAWATIAMDGLAPTYREAAARARDLSLAVDAVGPVLGAVTALRPTFIRLLEHYFAVRKDWRSVGDDRACTAASFRAEAIVLGDVLLSADVDELSKPWKAAVVV